MLKLKSTQSLLVLVLALSVMAPAARSALAAPLEWTGDWEMRYGQQRDQKPEWTQKGYIPLWRMKWEDRQAPVVSWEDQPNGNSRGWLLLARPVRISDPAPAALKVSFDYKTHCDLSKPNMKRSGHVYAIFIRRDLWDKLARNPRDAEVLNLGRLGKAAAGVLVRGHGDDVHEWTNTGEVEISLVAGAKPGEEYLAGIAWGAWHYGCDEHGAMRNLKLDIVTQEEKRMAFWKALDLERQGLEKVREAIEADDGAAAEHHLADYYRNSQRPKVDNPVQPAQSDRAKDKVRKALNRTYRLAGTPEYTFEGKIVWNLDPFNYDQWAIALNRHFEWPVLAAGYLADGDEAYAKEWAYQVEDWVKSMPVLIGNTYIQGPYNQPGRAALSLDAGIRMGQNWFRAFDVFRKSPSVPDSAIVAFVRSCWDHALYLMKDENFKEGSNWGAMECNGLYHIGVMMPEFREAPTWRKTALERLYKEMANQVYPDGAQQELAPGYHGVSLKNFLMVMELAHANDLELPDDFADRMEKMFDYYLRICRPNFGMPQFNDSGSGIPIGYVRDGFKLFPERKDFQWLATKGLEGAPPSDYVSCVMPWAGWVFMRSEWGRDGTWLVFDAGPFGTGHQHEDKLGILLDACGEELLTEGSVYSYDSSQWRKYVLSTRAHNTIRIDGKDQRCRMDRSQFKAEEPNTYGFAETDGFVYARDTHVSGYGDPLDKAVQHRRRVLFVKPDWYLVVDDLAASDEKTHEAEAQFLMAADSAEIEDGALRAVSEPKGERNARVAVAPLSAQGMKARIAKGETEPEVRGYISRGFERMEPKPAVLYSKRFAGRATLVWALVPFEGESCPLGAIESSEEGDALVARLPFGDSRGEVRVRVTPTRLEVEAGAKRFEADEPLLKP